MGSLQRRDKEWLTFHCNCIVGCSPGKAPPGAGQRAEDGSEGQCREEGVEREVEQALHPVIAQAFQRVNVVLRGVTHKDKGQQKDVQGHI